MCVYSNAADVLPPEVLREVQKHWRGLLYVPPATDSPQKEDTDFIRSMIRSGSPAAEIAAIAGVTARRVYQIARMLGAENPYQRRTAAAAEVVDAKHIESIENGSDEAG